MRKYSFLIIGTACLLFGLAAGCSSSSTSAVGRTDEQLKTAIKARIESDPQLRALDLKVSADADKNKVTLSGTVPSEALRLQAVQLAKEVRSDLLVNDEIKVKIDPDKVTRAEYTEQLAGEERQNATRSGEKLGDKIDDAWIHTKIRTKLAGHGEFPLGGINVDVVNNNVTLRGSVDSQKAKAEAERIAKETDGVAHVKNLLTVKSRG